MSVGRAGPEEAKIIREMICHEDNLITARTGWSCSVQSILFATVGLLWEKSASTWLIYILAVTGIVIALSFFLSVRAALLAVGRQRAWWDENKAGDYFGPDIIGRRPDHRSLPFLRPSVVVPIAFMAAWIAVLFVQATRNCA